MNITIVEEHLDGFRGEACLVKDEDDNYFVVSTITRDQFAGAYGDVETLAFKADEDGNIRDWAEIAGGGDMTRDDVIDCLSNGEVRDWDLPEVTDEFISSFDAAWYPEEEWEDYVRDDGTLNQY